MRIEQGGDARRSIWTRVALRHCVLACIRHETRSPRVPCCSLLTHRCSLVHRPTRKTKGETMIRKLLLAAAATALMASQAMFPTKALADTTLKLVEVITSPERTETLKSIVKTFEDANPGTKVEIISLPWGQAFEKFATMVSAGDVAGRRRDAGPLAVALRQQRHAREPRALSRQVGIHQGPQRPRARDGPLRQEHRLCAALRLLSARAVLQQEAVQAGRHRRAAEDARRLPRRPPRRSRPCPASPAIACAAGPAASTAG